MSTTYRAQVALGTLGGLVGDVTVAPPATDARALLVQAFATILATVLSAVTALVIAEITKAARTWWARRHPGEPVPESLAPPQPQIPPPARVPRDLDDAA